MDDYISREAVVRYLKGFSEKELNGRSNFGMITSSVLDKAERAISEMPAVDVQPVKHGRWISTEELYYNGMTKCSCCNEEYYIEDIQNLQGDLRVVNYCPNCGSKNRMDGDSDDEP